MAEISNIQWTDGTWNIARGCTKVDADCLYCYMYRESARYKTWEPKQVTRTKTVFNMPLRFKETKSKVWDGPPLIFTSSLTDVFHEAIDEYRHEMWKIIQARPDLTFQILTKRPERIGNRTLHYEPKRNEKGELIGGILHRNAKNVWIGTSVGSPKGQKRIYDLINSPWHGVKFLSLEPLHERMNLMAIQCPDCGRMLIDHGIDWIIVGGESGNENGQYRYRPCEIDWIMEVVDQCQELGIPVFVKQLGTHLAKKMGLKDRHGGDINEWPEQLRIRQMPPVPIA